MPNPSHDPMPAWKRALDVLCCLAAFPLFAVLTLVMALMVRLTSPGPILFRQERVGLNGRHFRIFKFRTMHAGADVSGHRAHFNRLKETNAPMQKLDLKGDNRLIAGGWILRATGLDELPQIVNIWRGEMSVVGPRPCIPYEYEEYTAEQRERFQSVPGLTGLWQVSGKNRTTFEEMIRLDRQYTAGKSLWLDLKIILLTVPALLLQLSDFRSSRRASSIPNRNSSSSPTPAAPGK